MFSWFKKKPAARTFPQITAANPGQGVSMRVAFTNGDRNWNEEANLADLLAEVLRNRSFAVGRQDNWVTQGGNELAYCPQIVDFESLEDGGVRTVTTIHVIHPKLMPQGIFEYQHSAGDSLVDSLQKGFDQWTQVDCLVYLESLRPKLESCSALELQFPAKNGQPAYGRRAILGPVAHLKQREPEFSESAEEEEHPFCPCCLLTRSFEAFEEQIKGTDFYGIRLYAARDEEGTPMADCRVNGEEWEPGKETLRRYASTWPAAGYEFRKQYVVIQTVPPRSEEIS
jgi:hypothetical protein